MSTFENENIDRLFNSLEEHSMDVEFDQFSDMEIRLEKLRYFRFGWKHFNIYYTGIIGVTFALSSIMFIDYLRREPVENKVVVMAADSTHTGDTVVVESSPAPVVIYRTIHKTDKGAPLAVLADSSFKNMIIKPPVVEPAPVKDTIAEVPKAPKPKRIIVIPKRDTIIKYDTTKVIKRK